MTRVLIVGAGPGHLPLVRVWDMATGQPMAGPLGQFLAYQASFRGGVFVAAGFLNGDGRADIVTGMGFGGGPKVKVFDGVNASLLTSFQAFQPKTMGSIGLFGDDNLFRSGLRVATTDLNGDGRDDIVVGPGRGKKPQVRAFRSLSRAEIDRFFAFQANYLGGVYVAGS